jgi:hypothetical protein
MKGLTLNPNLDGSYRPFSAKLRLNSALFIHQEGGLLNNELERQKRAERTDLRALYILHGYTCK